MGPFSRSAVLQACAGAVLAGALVVAPAVGHAEVMSAGMMRPSLWQACRAWHLHISDLIDQHRLASEIDDEQLGAVIRQFYEAQSACSAQRFDEALTLYEAIPLSPVRSRLLR